jgi:hypothetical protein
MSAGGGRDENDENIYTWRKMDGTGSGFNEWVVYTSVLILFG